MLPPQNAKEVKQFLGLIGYYRKFVPRFSDLARPLNALTRKNIAFEWTQVCWYSFNLLKTSLMTEPILTYPDPKSSTMYYLWMQVNMLGLVSSTHQRNYDHIFANIPIYDESNREEFFPWLDRLEAACYYCRRDIKTEA